jgi:putative phage-type endonuclease
MTLHEFPNLEQGSDAWHDARRGIVTASVVGKLLTPTVKVADNDTSRALVATLAAERITGWTEETHMTPDMWRGVDCEPIARDLYSTYYQQAREVGFLRRDEDEWSLGYSPDGLVGMDGLIEIKCPRAKGHILAILDDGVPDRYMPQCQAGLLVSGREWIDFVSYHGGLPLFVKRVYPSQHWFDAITAACIEFEKRVAELVADYSERVANMPKTERLVELEMSL